MGFSQFWPPVGYKRINYIMAPVNVGYQHATLILGAPSIHCFQGVWMQRPRQAMVKEKAKCRKTKPVARRTGSYVT